MLKNKEDTYKMRQFPFSVRNKTQSQALWLTPVIPAMEEAEIRRIEV
jgi:hypothetical protein